MRHSGMKLVDVHFSGTQCDTNYLVLLLLSALFCLSCSVNIFTFVFVMISVVCLHNRLTLCLSLDVVPSVLRYLLAIKNCFYQLIKCFYFHRTRFLVVVNGLRVCVCVCAQTSP